MASRYTVGNGQPSALGIGSAVTTYTTWTLVAAESWSDVVASAETTYNDRRYIAIHGTNGGVYGWGTNSFYGLGLTDDTLARLSPTQIISAACTSIALGSYTGYAVKSDGTLWVWGLNSYGELGLGDTTQRTSPVQVGSGTTWSKVWAGETFAIALKTDGTLWSAGGDDFGEIGQGATANVTSWTQIGTDTNWANVACGTYHAVALKTDGSAYAWGENSDNQIGSGFDAQVRTPTLWHAGPAIDLAAGDFQSILVLDTNVAYVTGYNANGQLGTTGNVASLTAVPSLSVERAWMGANTTILQTPSGAIYGAGGNTYYALGLGTAGNYSTFTLIPDFMNVTAYAGTLGTSQVLLAPDPTGTPTTFTSLYIAEYSTPTAETSLTVAPDSGTPSAPTSLTVTATATPSAPTSLAIIPVPSSSTPNQWSARCIVGGVDVSDQLTRIASVTGEEGAARIATVILVPPAGTIEPLDYVGKTITLDYVQQTAGVESVRRLFTGWVDTPTFNPATLLLTLECVDDLQNRVAALDRTSIDALIGGRYSAAVQGEIDDNWDYATAVLSTVTASLDSSASGGLRVTDWYAGATWATFDEGDLLFAEMVLELPQRSQIVNRVDIEYQYRYPRLRQRYGHIAWSGTQNDMKPLGYTYPVQADLESAANGTGWTVFSGIYFPAPARIPLTHEGETVWHIPEEGAIDMAIIRLAQRHSQIVTEDYTITVTAPESVTENGEIARSIRGALASNFDGRNWESAFDIEPLVGAEDGETDYSPDAERADSDHAIQTLLDQANVKIRGSHRGARVGNMIICDPDLDLDKRIVIDTDLAQASGKVARVEHRLDMENGSATTAFSIAVSGIGGAGIITPDTLTPPAPPAEATQTQNWLGGFPDLVTVHYGGTVYDESIMGLLGNTPEFIQCERLDGTPVPVPNPFYVDGGYPITGFRVRMPGVDDADRDPIEKPVEQKYEIIIPVDTLTFTIP